MQVLTLTLLLAGCGGANSAVPAPVPEISAQVSAQALAQPQPCTGAFVAHSLDYSTTSAGKIAVYEANGSGLAIGDLDGDGRLDLVMANLDGPNAILWNQGHFQFRHEDLAFGTSRAAAIVDVDADGKLDIVFTRRFEKPTLLHNTGQTGPQRFAAGPLPGVNNPFYSMTWGDLNGDGSLELIPDRTIPNCKSRLGQSSSSRAAAWACSSTGSRAGTFRRSAWPMPPMRWQLPCPIWMAMVARILWSAMISIAPITPGCSRMAHGGWQRRLPTRPKTP